MSRAEKKTIDYLKRLIEESPIENYGGVVVGGIDYKSKVHTNNGIKKKNDKGNKKDFEKLFKPMYMKYMNRKNVPKHAVDCAYNTYKADIHLSLHKLMNKDAHYWMNFVKDACVMGKGGFHESEPMEEKMEKKLDKDINREIQLLHKVEKEELLDINKVVSYFNKILEKIGDDKELLHKFENHIEAFIEQHGAAIKRHNLHEGKGILSLIL